MNDKEDNMKITMKAVMAGYSIARAADHVGYKRASLWRWESGRSRMPDIVKLMLCQLYGVKEEDIRDE